MHSIAKILCLTILCILWIAPNTLNAASIISLAIEAKIKDAYQSSLFERNSDFCTVLADNGQTDNYSNDAGSMVDESGSFSELDPNGDLDGDGVINSLEIRFKTDPTDSVSKPVGIRYTYDEFGRIIEIYRFTTP